MKVFECDKCRRNCVLFIPYDPNMCFNRCNYGPMDWQETDEYQIIEKPKPKEPELITLQSAIEKMSENPGSGSKCIKHGGVSCGFMVNDGLLIVTCRDGKSPYPFDADDFLGEKWEIVPAEPKVLRPEQIWYESGQENNPDDKNGFGDFVYKCIEISDKNGQIKERQNLQPLIDAVGDLYKIANKNSVSKETNKVFTEFKNIKPL